MGQNRSSDDELIADVLRRAGLERFFADLEHEFGQRMGVTSRRASGRTVGAAGCWVPPGTAVSVGRFTIPDGMVYVGKNLAGVSPRSAREPALIDPALKIAMGAPKPAGFQTSYYYGYRAQSYAELKPDHRAAYLTWLAAGRPAGAQTTYPLLFLAGLERRLLHDARHDPAAAHEVPALLAEVERLRGLYERDWSMAHNTSALLTAARAALLPRDPSTLPIPTASNGYELPIELKIAIGSYAANKQPVPPEWALAWYRLHPDSFPRTPAIRCPEEFDELFKILYRQHHGDGLLVRPAKTPLVIHYQPVNRGFFGGVALPIEGLSDVSRLTSTVKKLVLLGEEVARQLDQYSRFLASGRAASSLPALSLLPPALAGKVKTNELVALLTAARAALGESDVAIADSSALLPQWEAFDVKPTKRDAIGIARLLEREGIGVEPDPRVATTNMTVEEHVVLYKLSSAPAVESSALGGAMALLNLGLAVATAADARAPRTDAALTELLRRLPLTPDEQIRLRARREWLRLCPAKAIALKTQTGLLTDAARAVAPGYLVAVAHAGGRIDAQQMKVLERLYPLLGRTGEQLHRDVHELLTTSDAPIPVIPAGPGTGELVPSPRQRLVRLDPRRLADTRRSSARVASVLAEVFTAEDESPAPAAAISAGGDIPGLDAAHAAFVRALIEREAWDRPSLDRLAREHHLILGGAVERINDVSYSAYDLPVIELDGSVEIDLELVKRMLADADGQDQTA